MMNWISTICQICSAYFVLLFTIERFISVRFPLKRAIICTKRRINVAIVGIVVVAAVATVYELYYNNVYYYSSGKIILCFNIQQLAIMLFIRSNRPEMKRWQTFNMHSERGT